MYTLEASLMKKHWFIALLGGALITMIVAGSILLLRSIISPTHYIQCEAIRPIIVYNGISYSPATPIESSHQLTAANLGSVVGTAGSGPHNVQYTCDLLSPGQQVYRITGYNDTFRLAARSQNDVYFFEVGHNPHATLGADLFDIDGKVQFITVAPLNNPGSSSKTVRDPHSLQVLTKMVLEAPVAGQCSYEQDAEALLFHLKDGGIVETIYMPSSQALGTTWPQCVTLPHNFAATVSASQ